MKTYYLSFKCRPSPSHPNALRYTGMLADLFIAADSESGVEERAQSYLEDAGWTIEDLDYAEEVFEPSQHDARFAELFRLAHTAGIAGIFSPF